MGGLRVLAYDRWGTFLADLTAGISKAKHKQQINHKDVLSIACDALLTKGDRILWRYGGRWRENVVAQIDQEHDGGETLECECEWNVMEDLRLAHIRLLVMNGTTAQQALAAVLGQTTWGVGTVEDFGTKDFVFNLTNAYKALLEIAGEFGAEIRTDLEVGSYGVTSRRVSLVRRIGEDRANRFEYGRNMDGISKEVSDDPVYTAAYGYGKTLDDEDAETDGVRDRLTFSVNGKPYVEDAAAMELWGLPDGRGGKMHSFGHYENPECEDAGQLISETRRFLSENCAPKVTYKTDIPFAQLEGVELGDAVQVVDRDFTPELRMEARIGALTRDLVDGKTSSCEFGNVSSIVPDMLARSWSSANKVASAASASASLAYQQVKEMGERIKTQQFTLEGVAADGSPVSAVLTVDESGALCVNGNPI